MPQKTITEIISIKNDLGHFTIGYYPGTAPNLHEQPSFVKSGERKWDNPQDPIVYFLEVAEEDMEEAIAWMMPKAN